MTTEAAPERPLRTTIPEVKLGRIEQDVQYASMNSVKQPEWFVDRFGYDHGSLTVHTKSKHGGKPGEGHRHELVFAADGDILRSNVARAVHHFSPAVAQELIRGYRLARAAGLLGDGRYNPAAAKAMSTKVGHWNEHEHEESGVQAMAALSDVLRRENCTPGGMPLNDPPGKKVTT